MRFVVDCSVSVAWYVEDESNRYTERALTSLMKDGALVPSLWRTEFVNAVVMAERRGHIVAAKRRAILADAERLPIAVDHDPDLAGMVRLGDVAAEYGLSAYDAAYLELAHRARLPLATQDKALRRTARRASVSLL